jgi:hypothetical protein
MKISLEMEYSITPGKMVKGITIFIVILFSFLEVFIPFSIYYFENEVQAAILIFIFFTVLFISILGGTWVYSPQKYSLSNEEIKIVRPISTFSIPMDKIVKIEDRTYSPLKLWKMGGNGGLFSLTGSFYTKEDGKFWMYAKNDNYVMIYTIDTKYVLSPDEKDQFIIDVKNRMDKIKKIDEKSQ